MTDVFLWRNRGKPHPFLRKIWQVVTFLGEKILRHQFFTKFQAVAGAIKYYKKILFFVGHFKSGNYRYKRQFPVVNFKSSYFGFWKGLFMQKLDDQWCILQLYNRTSDFTPQSYRLVGFGRAMQWCTHGSLTREAAARPLPIAATRLLSSSYGKTSRA